MYTWAVKEIEKHKGRISELEQRVAELEKSLENARKEREQLQSEKDSLTLAYTQVLAEHDAALADNAALVEVIDEIAHRATDTLGGMDAHDRAVRVRQQPHPGAALLEVVNELRRYQYRDEPDVLATLRRLLTERSRIAHMINPEQHRKALEPLQAVVDGLASEMERTIQHRERKGGMSVPDHGDFCSAPPSMLARMRWWARELREALAGHTSALLVRAMNEGLEKAAAAIEANAKRPDDFDLAHGIRARKKPEEGGQS